MFNDGGVLPGVMGGPREPPAPTLQQRVCLVPELGRDTHRLPLSPSGQAATTQRNRNLEGGHRPQSASTTGRRWRGPAAGGGPVGSFCSMEEGGSPRTGGGGTSSSEGQ